MVTPAEEKGWFVRYGRRGGGGGGGGRAAESGGKNPPGTPGRHGSICREKTTRDHGARKGILGLLPPRSRSTPPFRLPTPHHMRESDVGGRPAGRGKLLAGHRLVSSRRRGLVAVATRRYGTIAILPPAAYCACVHSAPRAGHAGPSGGRIHFVPIRPPVPGSFQRKLLRPGPGRVQPPTELLVVAEQQWRHEQPRLPRAGWLAAEALMSDLMRLRSVDRFSSRGRGG
jgi:hypothetical protein